MYTLLFKKGNETFIIKIKDKKIHYWDRKEGEVWGGPIQFLPKDPETAKRIILSRGKIPHYFLNILNVSDEEYKEFQDAKDDTELREIVLRDCKKNGCKLLEEKK